MPNEKNNIINKKMTLIKGGSLNVFFINQISLKLSKNKR